MYTEVKSFIETVERCKNDVKEYETMHKNHVEIVIN